MALGFEIKEKEQEEVKPTKAVSRYSTEAMAFPCIIICATEENPLQQYKVKVLRMMFPIGVSAEEDMIKVYCKYGDTTVRLGKIASSQIKSVLSLFESNLVEGFLDADTPLKGDYLYVLSN